MPMGGRRSILLIRERPQKTPYLHTGGANRVYECSAFVACKTSSLNGKAFCRDYPPMTKHMRFRMGPAIMQASVRGVMR